MEKYQYNYTINIYCGCESGHQHYENPAFMAGFLLLWVLKFIALTDTKNWI